MATPQELFVDPSAPDGGTGTLLSPYNRQDLAIAAATAAEAVVYLKRGFVYQGYNSGTSSQGSVLYLAAKAPAGYLKIKPYGEAALPPTLFAGTNMLPGDTGWSYAGNGVWAKSMPDNASYAKARRLRLYVGGSRITGAAVNRALGTGYTFGQARARYPVADGASQADVLAAVGTMGSTAACIWTYTMGAGGGNGILYVWTGSALLDPPTFYDGITLVGNNGLYDASGFGRSYGILMYNCSRVRVIGIDAIFCPAALTITGNAASQDASVERARLAAFAHCGVLLEGASGATLTRAALRDSVVDAVATVDEDWNYRDKYGLEWINASQDASIIGRWTDSCSFERVQSIDGYHGNMFVGAMLSSGSGTTVNASVVDCIATNPNRLYGSACGAAGLGVGNIARFTRFHGYDVTYFFSRSGSGKTIFSNCVFRDAKKPYSGYDATMAGGLNVNTIPGISVYEGAAWGALEAGAVTMNSCAILQPYGFAIKLSTDTIPAGGVVLNNTVIVDTRWLNSAAARTFNPGVYDRAGISIDSGSCATVGAIEATDSYLYTGAAGQNRVAMPSFAVATLAAFTGLSGSLSEADPQVDSLGRPLAGSPLLGQAATNGLTRDAAGVYRNVMSARGAYEYVTARPLRTLP